MPDIQDPNLVLIIDDDGAFRTLARLALEDAGYQAVEAIHGLDAWDKLMHGLRPDIITLDLRMPELDGRGFRQRQLLEPRVRDIPIILFSSEHDIADIAKELCVDAWLAKTSPTRELVHALHDVLLKSS